MKALKQKPLFVPGLPDLTWINTPPAEEEIATNADGSQYMPIGIVEPKLKKLDTHWGTENFKFQVMELYGTAFVSGSLELVITYAGRTRRIVGSATMPVDQNTDFLNPDVNSNFAATVSAECIKNGAKKIGPAFGSLLNDRGIIFLPATKASYNGRKKADAVLMPIDAKLQEHYNNAVDAKNTGLIDTMKAAYPNITYTRKK